MKKRYLLPFAVLAACGGPTVQSTSLHPANEVGGAANSITAQDIRARISFLASDALKGRDTPSPGLEAAAAYIASEYARLGLVPKGDNGTFLQRYPYSIRTVQNEGVKLTIEGKPLVYGTDFFVVAGTPSGIVGTVPVKNIPGQLDRAWRTAVNSAREAARVEKAAAVVVVLDPSITADAIRERTQMFGRVSAVAPFPTVIAVSAAKAAEFGNRDHVTVIGSVPVSEVQHTPPNVVAVLRGSDPTLANEYVVLSAHMDHIGVTAPDARGDSINNGADDDASGTSAVVEVAEAMAKLGVKPLRSILFLNVSGEEKGLLGSRWFSDNPTVPLKSIVADINIDMIGRNSPDTVVAIGQEYSSLGPTMVAVVKAHPELKLIPSPDIWPQERFFFRSDHYNFARKEIPAIFFFSGVHEDYHRPSDEVAKIDADKASRIARLAYYLAFEIANRREPPKWTEQGLKEVRQLTR